MPVMCVDACLEEFVGYVCSFVHMCVCGQLSVLSIHMFVILLLIHIGAQPIMDF